MKWQVYTRGTIVPYLITYPMICSTVRSKEVLGVPVTKLLYAHEDGKMWWAWDDKESERLGAEIIRKCETEKSRKIRFKRMEEAAEDGIVAAEKIIATDLRDISDSGLLELYEQLEEESRESHTLLNTDIDAADVYLEKHIRKVLSKEIDGSIKKDLDDMVSTLLLPLYQSFIASEEVSVLAASMKSKCDDSCIEELVSKYWWVTLGWESLDTRTAEYYREKVSQSRKSPKQAKKRIEYLTEILKEYKRSRETILDKHNLRDVMEGWLYCIDKYALLHDLRKEMQVKYIYAMHVLACAVSRNKNVAREDIDWMTSEEVKKLLQGSAVPAQETQRRRKEPLLIIVDGDKWSLTVGPEAQKRRGEEIEQDIDKGVKSLAGVGASEGVVRGTVKICYGYKEALKKVSENDVLVVGMTTPDYVPAMRNSIAVVTDEGGITCHAAIVAREMKKPCVIGTKIATQVLKDGDMVEVDADNGVVRKIESLDTFDLVNSYLSENESSIQQGIAANAFADLAFESFLLIGRKHDIEYSPQFSFFRGKQFTQMTPVYIQDSFSRHIYDLYMESPDSFDKFMIEQKDISKRIDKLYKGFGPKITHPSFSDFVEEQGSWWRIGIIGEDKGRLAHEDIISILKERKLSKSDAEKALVTLTRLDRISDLTRPTINELEIRKEIKDGKDVDKLLKKYITNYFFYRTTLRDRKVMTLQTLKDEFSKESSVDEDVELLELSGQDIRAQQKALEEKFNFSPEELRRIAYLRRMVSWVDERRIAYMKNNYYYFEILHRIADQFEIEYDTLAMYTAEEVVELLKTNKILDADEISARAKGFFIVYETNQPRRFFYGKEAKELLDTARKPQNTSQVTGLVASRGNGKKVKGRVRIIKREDDPVLEKEEVLVTSMTRPEFVKFMKTAAAIVTDEGGIACHAAIVSREMGKLCIIGTKHATQIFKDGDMVEVDAEKGVVKKI